MKKSFRHILLAGLTLVSAGLAANAQTLTQDWKYTTDIPAASNARWGTGIAGKVWTNDKSVPQLIYWDSEGKHALDVGSTGTAIATDAVGNIIVNDGFPNAVSSTNYKILPVGGTALQDLTVTLPEGVTAGRMDFMGRAAGDIMSEAGGAFYICSGKSPKIAKIFVAKGVQVAEKSKALPAIVDCGTDGIAQPLDNNAEGDNFIARPARNQNNFSYLVDGIPTAYATLGASSTAGGDVVTLNGVTYTIECTGTAYLDGFQIVDRSTNTAVAAHVAEFEAPAAKPNQNALTVEKVDEYTANIYQYVPGQLVAKYTFSLPKPMPKLEARNAYAYDINVAEESDNYVVTYRLNAPAESAKVQLWANGAAVKEFEGTTIAEYSDEEKTTVNNLNTVTVPKSEMVKDARVSFRVAVTSATVAEPTAYSRTYGFWSPYGIAVDNNTDSPTFGRVLVTESQTSLPATGYHSSTGENGIGIGLYAFDQMLQPIKNAEGKYGFLAGMTQATGKYPNGSASIYDFKRLQYSEDGRLFVSRVGTGTTSLWEINPQDLNAPATEIFKGTLGEDGYVTNDAGEFVAGPATAMTVTGKGNDLKVAIVACKDGYVLSPNNHRVDIYNLGTAKEWTGAPSKALESVSGQYWINSAVVNAQFDADGKGLMIGQYRATPTAEEPAYVHVNEQGVVDYTELTYKAGGAAMAWNADKSLFAMTINVVNKQGIVGVFEVTKDENGAPVFTKKYEFNTTCGTNTNALAFDVANNIYVASNSGEVLKSFSLPRENGEVVVAAPSKYDVTISSDEYPAELFLIGSVTNPQWNPADGVAMKKGENGVYTATITTNYASDNIGIVSVLSSNWVEVNANRWGMAKDNDPVVINEATPIVKGPGAIMIGAVGTFDVTVDLKNLTILVEGEEPVVEYPETLYMIGNTNVNGFDPSDTSIALDDLGEGNYEMPKVDIHAADEAGFGYFAFTATPGASSDDWATCNANRYGPVATNTELTDNVAGEIGKNGDTSYKVKAGQYDVVINLAEGTITLKYIGSGAEAMDKEEAKAVGGNGEIRIIGEAQVSIYSVNGQAIAINSTETSFAVAKGVYVVVIDGKSTKVMVK